jgi:hypothetical protein
MTLSTRPALFSRPPLLSVLFAAAFTASGCSGAAVVAVPTGSVVMDWTINGAKDPAHCQISGAAVLHVSLHHAGGAFAGEYAQDCAAFATTIEGLVPDTYGGHVELVDQAGRPRTTSVDLAPFDVIGNATVVVDMDFPADSFL